MDSNVHQLQHERNKMRYVLVHYGNLLDLLNWQISPSLDMHVCLGNYTVIGPPEEIIHLFACLLFSQNKMFSEATERKKKAVFTAHCCAIAPHPSKVWRIKSILFYLHREQRITRITAQLHSHCRVFVLSLSFAEQGKRKRYLSPHFIHLLYI